MIPARFFMHELIGSDASVPLFTGISIFTAHSLIPNRGLQSCMILWYHLLPDGIFPIFAMVLSFFYAWANSRISVHLLPATPFYFDPENNFFLCLFTVIYSEVSSLIVEISIP